MPDLARHRPTGIVMDAYELACAEEELTNEWVCPGCDVVMIPVACGDVDYKVSAHFRAIEPHDATCSFDGLHPNARRGEIRNVEQEAGHPAAMPNVLRLATLRPQLRDECNGRPDTVPVNPARGAGDDDGVRAAHAATASMLHRIAAAYCRYPAQRGARLRIPNCGGRTYQRCFRRLKNAHDRVLYEYRVLFASIRFSHPTDRDNVVTIELEPAIWRSGWTGTRMPPDERYRVAFHTEAWSQRSRDRFRHGLDEAVAAQRVFVNARNDLWRTYVFFLGEQDPRDWSTFLVEDHRLVCFLRLHRDVIERL